MLSVLGTAISTTHWFFVFIFKKERYQKPNLEPQGKHYFDQRQNNHISFRGLFQNICQILAKVKKPNIQKDWKKINQNIQWLSISEGIVVKCCLFSLYFS